MPVEQCLSKKVFCKGAKLSLRSEILEKTFVKVIFSRILGYLPGALLKKLLHIYFSRSLIIDFRILIFTEGLPAAASKIHRFVTSFMKSELVG